MIYFALIRDIRWPIHMNFDYIVFMETIYFY